MEKNFVFYKRIYSLSLCILRGKKYCGRAVFVRNWLKLYIKPYFIIG
ncbi:hypothetical protein KsCSTR_23050 [Candidatus Kuenenia stuttgartiensis]|uniref:Uncharacterized protein n=1 Tax=Kuenenia stuttgartiensis TaxID=174633 RepID=Q1Q3J0_KUEST|nr:hypothetical protein KsCSTR_23050 [Candidatus Kuenenia stuttgartiensis]CAJ74575.1 unknown protein [Candidatus Kuenenia stuttgartiensis]